MQERCYSRDSCHFHDDVTILNDAPVGTTVWVGDIVRIKPSEVFDDSRLENLLESLDEHVDTDYGIEEFSNFSDLSQAKRVELKNLIGTWLDTNVKFTWFSVENIEEHTIEEADHGSAPAV